MATRIHPLQIAFSVIIGVALIGFVAGVTRPPESRSPLSWAEQPAEASLASVAPSYGEERTRSKGQATFALDAENWAGPGLLEPVSKEGSSVASDLATRSTRRAFDGAPPTIPHEIVQGGAPECLACHEEGLRVRDRLAPPMSHRHLSSCTQCHVVALAPMPGVVESHDATRVANSFAGRASASSGDTAWTGAPPVIPHSTFMRERCESCHGTNGRDALRTPHPDRQSCTQCHGLSAAEELRPGLPAGAP